MSTILEIAQNFCKLYNLPVPTYLENSTDAGVIQLRQMLLNLGVDIKDSAKWQVCSRRVVWTSIQGEFQGYLSELCPENLDYIIPQTFWDNTLRRPVYGPVDDYAWQQLKSMVPQTPLYQFRTLKNELLIYGPMPAGHQLSLMYKTKNWVQVAGSDPPEYTASDIQDADTPVFPDRLFEYGFEYMWRRIKGMKYDTEYNLFLAKVKEYGSKDSVQPVISMDGASQPNIQPGIWVPAGNWQVQNQP